MRIDGAGQSGSLFLAVDADHWRPDLVVHAYGSDAATKRIRIRDDIFGLLDSWGR